MARKPALSGAQRFDQYYRSIYGERWNSMTEAFAKEAQPVMLKGLQGQPYYMDKASILCANILPAKAGDCVLDMCAAPGGKSLVLAMKLDGNGSLTSNDRSAQRRNRLINVLKSSLSEKQAGIVKVTGYDSTKWGLYEQNAYDCVLLDAPCSSERHVFNDPKALEIWSPSRPKMLAIQQFAMLAAALAAVKEGGYVLYSTCSVNPAENQDVISKLCKKRSGAFEELDIASVSPEAASMSQPLEHGRIVLPDVHNGCGPMYFCLMRKKNETEQL